MIEKKFRNEKLGKHILRKRIKADKKRWFKINDLKLIRSGICICMSYISKKEINYTGRCKKYKNQMWKR